MSRTMAAERAATAVRKGLASRSPYAAITSARLGELVSHELAHLALSAALSDRCHETVTDAQGEEGPCDRAMVGYRIHDEATYPVCSRHARPPMAPLQAAILGGVA